MPTRWKVSYTFSGAVDVQNPIVAYDSIGVSLYYNGNNKLIRVEHELDVDNLLEKYEVINTSQEQLKFFWELLHYQRGISLPISHLTVEIINPATGVRPIRTGVATIISHAAICRSIKMPDPRVFKLENNRLLVWFRLANEARDSKSAVDAIRNYYMIWEDSHGVPTKANAPKEAIELKFVRDFVSHGLKLENPELLKFIEDQFGKSINQFDPTDAVQQDFVNRYRTLGRNLVETELDRLLELYL